MNPYTAQRIALADTYLPAAGPLATTNRGFHECYNHLLGETLDRLGHAIPVLVMLHDDLHLSAAGSRQYVQVVPEHYHQLKAVAHSGFGMQLWLMTHRAKVLNETLRSQLQANSEVLRQSRAALDCLPIAERATPATLLDTSLGFIHRIMAAGGVETELVEEYSTWMAPHVMKLARAAVRLEIDALHEATDRWRRELGESMWRDVYVVLCGTHQPRYRQAASQYFDRVLGEHPGIGAESEDRIVFAENIDELDGAFDLLARHIVDQQASTMIFGYRGRLQKDLLADVATEYLDQILPTGE
ncbi:hypothetical protein NG895_03270 [Aeoliella sp. ICT_H6.2]|uniref:Uncharacterized protein n=1 Tax=Aeoliella straminimaris TaxID=2954799 RepID=A0A9X2F644_9BACT|nr:hypothetical protein [Aeoliella straminimaris]MCO6042920.1 hypothetical protein [Aeoliella straminimaris]